MTQEFWEISFQAWQQLKGSQVLGIGDRTQESNKQEGSLAMAKEGEKTQRTWRRAQQDRRSSIS